MFQIYIPFQKLICLYLYENMKGMYTGLIWAIIGGVFVYLNMLRSVNCCNDTNTLTQKTFGLFSEIRLLFFPHSLRRGLYKLQHTALFTFSKLFYIPVHDTIKLRILGLRHTDFITRPLCYTSDLHAIFIFIRSYLYFI